MRVPFVSTALLLCIAAAAGGQTAPDTASVRQNAEAAERAGNFREALRLYTSLQRILKTDADRPEDDWVYPIIFRVSTTVRPLPALPDSAEMFELRGQFLFDSAKTPADFARGAEQFRNAIVIAPWKPDYFYNVGLIAERTGAVAAAVRWYRLYMQHPAITDRDAVRRKLVPLEYQLELDSRLAAFDEWVGDWSAYLCEGYASCGLPPVATGVLQSTAWRPLRYAPPAPVRRRGDTLYVGWNPDFHGVIRGASFADVQWFERAHPGNIPEDWSQCTGFDPSGIYPVHATILKGADGSAELHFTRTRAGVPEAGCRIRESVGYGFALRREATARRQ